VTGQNQSTAESILTGAGLTPTVVYDPVTDPTQDGIVQSEDPPPGSDAKAGEVVIIHVGQLQNGGGGGGGGGTTTSTTTTSTP
jgi:beta-lactam-binding protein with PASTA domain